MWRESAATLVGEEERAKEGVKGQWSGSEGERKNRGGDVDGTKEEEGEGKGR